MAVVQDLTRYAVYHRRFRPDEPHRAKEAGVFDAVFVVLAYTKEAAEKVVRDRMKSSFNEAVTVVVSKPDKSGVELEFYYAPPRATRRRIPS